MTPQNTLAQTLKSLHQPGKPLILTNIWDAISANAVASLPGTKALATASAAIAAAANLADEELTLPINLHAIRAVAGVARTHNLPLTVDFQDGFGDQLLPGARQIIELGAVGMNLEDFDRGSNALFSIGEAQERIRSVMRLATEMSVPDFVVNARTDTLLCGGSVDEAVERGKAFLEAGATNVFIWGGGKRGGWSEEEVTRACRVLEGKLNVILVRAAGGLSVARLREIGVARISVGPQLMRRTVGAVGEEARKILEGEGV